MKKILFVVFSLFSLVAQDVGNIEIKGSQRIEKQTIISYLPMQIGEPINQDLLDSCLKSLYDTGYFQDVKVVAQGSSIIITVVENPVINKVAFEGNSKLKDDDLRKELHLKTREVLSYSKMQTAQQTILEIYRRMGRFSATVDLKIIKLPENRVDLVFEIAEGPTTNIRKINFIGNDNFSASALEKELQSKVWHWYRFFVQDDIYDPDRFLNDQQQIINFYQNHGYPNVKIIAALAELSSDKTAYFLTFKIIEGDKFAFGSSTIASQIKGVNTTALNKDVAFKEKDIFDQALIDQTVTNLTNQMGDLGYAFVAIEPILTQNLKKKTIDVKFQINEGPRVYIEKIEITGNDRTFDGVIRREISINEGDAFNTSKLKDSEKTIKELDFFKDVSLQTEEGSKQDQVKVVVNVEEKRTGEANFGISFSSLEGPAVNLSAKEINLNGSGNELEGGINISKKSQGISASFANPAFLDRDLVGRVSVFANRSNIVKHYKESSVGSRFDLEYNLSKDWSQRLYYGIKKERVFGTNKDTASIIREQSGNALISEIGQTIYYSTLDSVLAPSKGFLSIYDIDFAGVGGNVKFLRHTLSATAYYPLYKNQVIFKAIGEIGLMQKIGKRPIRVVDSLSLGYDTFRGFEYNGVGARDSKTNDGLNGTRMWRFVTEIKFPLGLPEEWKLTGTVFNEFGSLWKPGQRNAFTLDSKHFRASAGAGIRWTSPFGLLGIFYSKPYRLQKFDQVDRLQIFFNSRF